VKKEGFLPQSAEIIFPRDEAVLAPPAGYRVMFLAFLLRGLSLPTHEFLRGLIFVYGVQLHQLTPNSVLHIQPENGAARNGRFGAVFAVAPIGLDRNGAKVKLERGGAGFLKMRTGAVWSGPVKGTNKWAEPVGSTCTGLAVLSTLFDRPFNPHPATPFFLCSSATALRSFVLAHLPSNARSRPGGQSLMPAVDLPAPPPPQICLQHLLRRFSHLLL
jgi:hypothetical protein